MARATHQSALRYPLTFILGTDVGLRLSRELARHGGQLSAPDLARRTGLSPASVSRGLGALVRTGTIEAAGTGRSLLYRLHRRHPLAAPMAALFEAEDRRFQSLLDSVRAAATAAGPGLLALWLFGSAARGEDRLGSDFDLALVAEPDSASASSRPE